MSSFAVPAMNKSVTLMMLVGTVGGCGGSGHWMSAGPKPIEQEVVYPANYKSELLDFMRTFLADPTNVRDALISEPALASSGTQNHYFVCIRYNARVDGKYLGMTSKLATYYGGQINQFIDAATDQCGNAAYQPFPELEHLKPLGK
jgi:hypothetical protein